ncbi:hypothetical protein [Streptomyces cavernicola]|uniref:hypothetical protein n=1 Tax=Streptomyces cavernicola TaxID=3043613 RepID=UPI0038CFCEB5
MTFGFAPSAAASKPGASQPAEMSDSTSNELARVLEPAEWAAAGIPLLRDPREVVSGLHLRHLPTPETAVVAVLDQEERLRASASFSRRATGADGWVNRNALLAQLRRVIPHDLRRRTPVRTAVLLYCREGDAQWTQEDGAWMWGLRDACTLHGLRCGAYITLTHGGWQVLGEGRGGRRPHIGSLPGQVEGGWHLEEPDERAGAGADAARKEQEQIRRRQERPPSVEQRLRANGAAVQPLPQPPAQTRGSSGGGAAQRLRRGAAR